MARKLSLTLTGAALASALLAGTAPAQQAPAAPFGQTAPAFPGGRDAAPRFPPAAIAPQPGRPAPFPMAPFTPEMGRKTAAIMALREMLAMRLTAKDIATALPPLKDLRSAQKTLDSQSERLLDDEKRALLAADPDGPPPPGNGEKMHRLIEDYHRVQTRTWDTLTRTIGRDKARGLSRLIGQGPEMGIDGFGRPGGGGLGGGLGGQRVQPDPRRRPDTRPPGSPAPLRPEDNRPGIPFDPERALPDDSVLPILPAAFPEEVPADLLTSVQPEPGAQNPDTLPALPLRAPVAANQDAPAVGRVPGQAPPAADTTFPGRARISAPRLQNQFGAATIGGPFGPPVRITLTELIELLEQKQAAMRR